MDEQRGPFLFFKVLGFVPFPGDILHQKDFPGSEFAFLTQGGLNFDPAIQKDNVLSLRGPVKIIVVIGGNLSQL